MDFQHSIKWWFVFRLFNFNNKWKNISYSIIGFCQISRTALNSIKQYKFWFTGSSKYYSDVKYYMSKYNIELSKNKNTYLKYKGELEIFYGHGVVI